MSELTPVWHQVERYIDDGLSIIPVYDKDGLNYRNEEVFAKMPIGRWTYNQKNRFTKKELWDKLEKFNTTAVGIVCGEVSGKLEVIDVDSKYYPGIDAILFKDIKTFYPDVFALLRIHKTPSGGFHIIYRVSDGVVPGNLKLAGRLATEHEKQEYKKKNPLTKRELKEINFLETRGEGGQFVAPPSLNYSVYQDLPIPVITWEQRSSLIELCRSYTQIIKEVVAYKTTSQEDKRYSINPFEDFNARVDPEQLANDNGWRTEKFNSKFIWFTRPGKERGVSLSWNIEKRIFYSFSSSTDLDENRGYNAASFLAIYQFNNDRKATYKWLVENGYGELKPNVEKAIIQRAKRGHSEAPANLSESAKEQLTASIQAEADIHPHGIFWEINDEEDKYSISRELLYNVSHALGFRIYNEEPVQIIGSFIHTSTIGKYFDALKSYIKETDWEHKIMICNCLETFFQNSGKYTVSRLREIDTDYILKDTATTSYKCYQNYIAEVTEHDVSLIKYEDIDQLLIWEHKVFKRDIVPFDKSPKQYLYLDYLHKAIGIADENQNVNEYLYQIIGYLAHDHKDENTGYIVTLTERAPDPKGGGGSGKNIFGNLLRHITTVCTVAGSQIQFNEKFLQAWNEERVFFMADVPKRFDWEYLKEMSTGYGTLKKLFKDERTIAPQDMPKLLANTNFSFDASDGGLKRRILPIEFTNFFTAAGGVDAHYGCMFPAGWSTEDWYGYDWFMFTAIQKYFKCKGKIVATELSYTGWEKQFKQKYGELTFNFIHESMEQWLFIETPKIDAFNKEYHDFCIENNIVEKRYQLSSIMMNRALADYCERHGISFNPLDQISENNIKSKVKVFKKDEKSGTK
jgi:hypothetical protein